MTKVPQDTSVEEPDGGNLQVRLRRGLGSGDRPGLLNTTENPTSQLRFIPVRQLTLSPLNVRKTGGDAGVAELAQLIETEGLLQNLSVYECVEDRTQASPTYAVIAGGRRWRALQLLIEQKRITPEYAVPCLLVSYERAVQISLTENSGREPMLGRLRNLSSMFGPGGLGIGVFLCSLPYASFRRNAV